MLNDHKLIDLSLAIHDAKVGTEGSEDKPDEDTEIAKETEKEAESEQVSDNKTAKEPVQKVTKTIKIEIRNKTIKCNGEVQKDAEVLKKLLMAEYEEGCAVSLVDDYAEAHVYREVRAMLDGLKSSLDLEYGEK